MEQEKPKRQWQRKLMPIVFFWVLFLAITAGFNEAPAEASGLTTSNIVLFFVPLFCALLLTTAFAFHSKRRGFEASVIIVTLLLFRLYKITSPILVLLLLGFVGFIEWYLSNARVKGKA